MLICGLTLRIILRTRGRNITRRRLWMSQSAISPKMSSALLDEPEKAIGDRKEYRVLRLPNGLLAMLIADTTHDLEAVAAAEDECSDDEEDEDEDEDEYSEDSEEEEDEMSDGESPTPHRSEMSSLVRKSAAALCVGVGSFMDDVELPGLAHFVEHMVFMGSEKYPEENTFDAIVQKYGGYDNASTDCETTVFHFDVQRRHFEQTLDVFASLFVSPLMGVESMEREREAVDSEFEMAFVSDSCRKQQLLGSLANEGHPMAAFMWGNTKSLRPPHLSESEINERLHAFRRRYYVPSNMRLVVQSQHTLDTLQKWVEQSFGPMIDSEVVKEDLDKLGRPFGNEKFNKLYKVVPIKNQLSLDLNWALCSQLKEFRVKPLHFLSWIIGHEGKGSLVSWLRRHDLALSLTAGNAGDGFEHNSTHSIFSISLLLTSKGFEQLELVLDAIFDYLAMLRSQEIEERIYLEIQRIEQLEFDYGEELQPDENVEKLCENMHFYPPSLYLKGDDLMFQFDPKVIQRCLDALVPEGVNLMLASRSFRSECKTLEPWFNTKYKMESINETWLQRWRHLEIQRRVGGAETDRNFHLPEKNEFISNDLTLKKPVKEYSEPRCVWEEGVDRLFFKPDSKFRLPRGHIMARLEVGDAMEKLRFVVALDLFVDCIAQLMAEDVYPADLAQLNHSLHCDQHGVVLKVSGLNDNLASLFFLVLKHVVNFEKEIEQSSHVFESVKEQMVKNYHNHFIKNAKLNRDVRLSILQKPFHTSINRYREARTMSLEEVRAACRELRSKLRIQMLVQGNFSESEARDIFSRTRKELLSNKDEQNIDLSLTNYENLLKCRILPEKANRPAIRYRGLNSKDGNTVVTNYYQLGTGDMRRHVMLQLAVLIMEEPLFDTLRTKEQLGYQAEVRLRNTTGILGLTITISSQASKFKPGYVSDRIQRFVDAFIVSKLSKLSNEEWEESRSTLIKEKEAADVTLEEEVDRNWAEMMSHEYVFNRSQREIEMVNSIQKREVVDALKNFAYSKSKGFKVLSIQVVGNENATKNEDKENEEMDADDQEVSSELELLSDKDVVKDPETFRDDLQLHETHHIVK